jgi:hypothetical protein
MHYYDEFYVLHYHVTIATNNCLLHVPSITTDSNSLQVPYITSKTRSLHYHTIYLSVRNMVPTLTSR